MPALSSAARAPSLPVFPFVLTAQRFLGIPLCLGHLSPCPQVGAHRHQQAALFYIYIYA